MRYIALVILLISFKLEGQYQFDFEIDSSGGIECFLEGMWRQVPEQRWCCDSIQPIEENFSLHHSFDNPQEGCDYLVLWCDQLNTSDPFSFSFRIRHGFAPSSMNNWQLVLGARLFEDQEPDGPEPDPGASDGEAPYILNGIVIGVNFTGTDDHIKMWGVRYGLSEILCSTLLNYQEQVGTDRAPLFHVQGDGEGNLELYWSPDPAEQALAFLGSCKIGEMDWGRQLLLRYKYTSSRDRALWLDRLVLEGHYEKDTIAPVVSAVELLDGYSLLLGFSEKVMLDEACKFTLYSEERPGGVIPDSLRKMEDGVIISFPKVLPNRVSHQLRVEGVVDLDGNLLEDTLVHVMRNEAQWGDLVFNEVMADPDPAVRHSEEYLELYMRSDYPLNLEGWQLKVNDRSYLLNTSNLMSMNGGDADGEFIVLKGIILPNDGAILSLYDQEGTLIHAASYTIPWDGPDWKKEGGWSLESPDAEQVCRVSASWDYSKDPEGGTPGRINSNGTILTDKEPPVLRYAGEGDPGELLLHYTEPIRLPHDAKAAFSLDPGGVAPDSVRLLDPLQETLQLYFSGDFQDWPLYRLTLSGLSDCAGNRSDNQVVIAGAVSQPAFASVLINEIMYDPEEGKPEYVELFLPGDKIIDLQDLAIHLVEEGGSPDHPIVLAPHSRLFLPGQFLVLTNCVPQLEETYGLEVSGQWVEVAGLPGLKNSSGTIYLTDRAGQVVDMAVYKDEMHMELLDDPRGISLERISVKRPGSDPENWHSAASISGYATPGLENSQSFGVSESDLLLDVLPEVFSPDNDGYNDLLKIIVNTGGNDWVIGLLITDLQGNRIRVLANNHLAGPTVCYTWDGEGENGSMQPMGFYVIHARGYRPATGEQWIRRKGVGLVYR
jgi:hypothetical protein